MKGEEMLRQRQDVFAALAQRRDLERDYAQAEIQVSAEFAGRYFAPQLAIGRRHDAHVDLPRLRRAYPQHLAVLEHAQQLSLEVRARLADLVEKQRAARGALEASEALANCAGEGSFLMAEQLALDPAVGQRLAVDGEEWTVGAIAPVMKHPGDQLLAGAGLALDERGRARRRDAPNHGSELAALRRLGDEAGCDAGDVELLAPPAGLPLRGAHLDGPRDDGAELVAVERFRDAVEGATAQGGLGRLGSRQRHAQHD